MSSADGGAACDVSFSAPPVTVHALHEGVWTANRQGLTDLTPLLASGHQKSVTGYQVVSTYAAGSGQNHAVLMVQWRAQERNRGLGESVVGRRVRDLEHCVVNEIQSFFGGPTQATIAGISRILGLHQFRE